MSATSTTTIVCQHCRKHTGVNPHDRLLPIVQHTRSDRPLFYLHAHCFQDYLRRNTISIATDQHGRVVEASITAIPGASRQNN